MKIILTAAILAFASQAYAFSCNEDCNHACCAFGVCEPVCKSSCEATKAVCNGSGGALPVLHPPGPGDIQNALQQSCASGFNLITKYVIFTQPFYGSGSDYILNTSRDILVQLNLFSPQEFGGVNIRWCKLSNGTGMTPDSNIICLNDRLFINNQPLEAAITLAHEMIHVRQYRRGGTDAFKCEYSQEYISCRGDQGRCMPLEREAYNFEDGTACPILAARMYGPSFNAQAWCAARAHSNGR